MRIFKYYATILILATLLFSGLLKGQRNVDFVGDSITEDGFPKVVDSLALDLGKNFRTFNYGVGGAGIVNNPYKNTTQFQDVKQRSSEIIVVTLGTNDISGYIGQDDAWRFNWEIEYKTLINGFKWIATENVFLGTIIYQAYSSDDLNAVIDKMNTVIRKAANEYGLKVIDFNTAMGKNTDNFQSDGIHPSEMGKDKLAETAFDFLSVNISTLSIDDEYWEAVEEYEKNDTGFGCSWKNPVK